MTPATFALLFTAFYLVAGGIGLGFGWSELTNARSDEAARKADPKACADERQRIVGERGINMAFPLFATQVIVLCLGLLGVAALWFDPIPPAQATTPTTGQLIRGWSYVASNVAIEVVTLVAILVCWRARHKFPTPKDVAPAKKGG